MSEFIRSVCWRVDFGSVSSVGGFLIYSPFQTNFKSNLLNLLQTSLMSATSLESRCGGQVFATTGQYRGVIVRIKELKFSKKKDVTRETMKEMRRSVKSESFHMLWTAFYNIGVRN